MKVAMSSFFAITVGIIATGCADIEDAPLSEVESAVCGGGTLEYLGGDVMEAVKVVVVFWGQNVDPSVKAAMPGFYRAATNSPYFDTLDEYGVGRGSVTAVRTIIPSTADTQLTAAEMEAEIFAQVRSGNLPNWDANTIYMIHIPKGTIGYFSILGMPIFSTVNSADPACSSSSPSCAFHGYSTYHGFRYAVMPDYSGLCATVCGGGNNIVESTTIVASHELVEAVTDPDYDSWRTPILSLSCAGPREVCDLCVPNPNDGISDRAQLGRLSLPEHSGRSYLVNRVYSKESFGCYDEKSWRSTDLLWRNADGTPKLWRFHPYPSTNNLEIIDTPIPSQNGVEVRPGNDWSIQATGDFNRDGKSDILWRSTDGGSGTYVRIWLMDGGAILAQPTPCSPTPSATCPRTDWRVVGTGDFDGDGDRNILWRHTDSGNGTPLQVWFMENGLLATTGNICQTSTGSCPHEDWQILGVRDVNTDSVVDIVWRNTNGTVHQWLMSGSIVTAQRTVTTVSAIWKFEGLGDFDVNGVPDILWRCTASTCSVGGVQHPIGTPAIMKMAHTGLGSPFVVPTHAGVAMHPDVSFKVQAVADLDGDGFPDILWRNTTTLELQAWRMNSTGVLNKPAPRYQGLWVKPGLEWQIQGVGAFD